MYVSCKNYREKDIKKNKRVLMTKFVPEIAASSQQKRGILDYIE